MNLFNEIDEPEDDDFLFEEEGVSAAPEAELLPPRQSSLCLGCGEQEKQLLDLINAGKMPHALIFAGPKGIGKATFAFRLARYLLAKTPADPAQDSMFGEASAAATSFDIGADTPTFRQVASGGHPDLMVAERAADVKKSDALKATLDTDTIRKITPFLRMTASNGGWRLVIVDDADTMNRNAQNALLKILEEPPANALLILVTHRPGAMIPTIRSRCRVVSFDPPEEGIFTDILGKGGHRIAKEEIDLLSSLSGSSPGRAMALLDQGGMEMVRTVLSPLQNWPKAEWPLIHRLAEQIGRYGNDGQWQIFQQVILWLAESLVLAKARPKGSALPAILSRAPFPMMLSAQDQQALTGQYDWVKESLLKTDIGNLDRRQTILSIYDRLLR